MEAGKGLAELAISARNTRKKVEDDFFKTFSAPGQAQVQKQEKRYIYIWKENKEVFKMYQLLTNYFGENYKIDSNVLIKLIEEKRLPFEETFQYIAYLHAGYITEILENLDGNTEK